MTVSLSKDNRNTLADPCDTANPSHIATASEDDIGFELAHYTARGSNRGQCPQGRLECRNSAGPTQSARLNLVQFVTSCRYKLRLGPITTKEFNFAAALTQSVGDAKCRNDVTGGSAGRYQHAYCAHQHPPDDGRHRPMP